MSDTPPYRQGDFYWSELATTDVPKAKAFYSQLFGWTPRDVPMPGMDGSYTMLEKDGQDVGAMYEMGAEQAGSMPPNWGYYIYVDDVDATFATATANGATELMGPMDIPGVGRMATIMDPTGAAVSIMKGAENAPGSTRPDGGTGSFSWYELMSPDADKSKSFYQKVVGYGLEDMDMGGGMNYGVLKVGETSVGGVMQMLGDEWAGIPPHWMGYVTVTDCDATAAKVTELGGEIKVPPTDVPGIGRFSVIQDPTGAVVSFITYVAS